MSEICFCAIFYKDVLSASQTAGCGCLNIFEKFDEAGRLKHLCTYLYCMNVSLIYNKRALFFYKMRSQCLIWFKINYTPFGDVGFYFPASNADDKPLLCDTRILEKSKHIDMLSIDHGLRSYKD